MAVRDANLARPVVQAVTAREGHDVLLRHLEHLRGVGQVTLCLEDGGDEVVWVARDHGLLGEIRGLFFKVELAGVLRRGREIALIHDEALGKGLLLDRGLLALVERRLLRGAAQTR